MPKRIRKDLERFKRIVRGEIRKNLKELVESGVIVGQKGRQVVQVPVRSIRIPQFRYAPQEAGGVGSGQGDVGTPVKIDEQASRAGLAGSRRGAHCPEVEVELRELAEILGEELELPRIQPRGERQTLADHDHYQDVSVAGPESLLMKKRSYRQGLLRQMLMEDRSGPGTLHVARTAAPPLIVTPIKDDKRYLYAEPETAQEANCAILFMRDASGSMGGEKTDIIRQENYWIDIWLRYNYREVERVYILHDYDAQLVDEEDFYQLSTGGGTRISSAYELCAKVIERRFPPDRWNIYAFHFSDGENWIGDSENACVPLLRDKLLTWVNAFCYGQVALGRRSPGMHLAKLKESLGEHERLSLSIISGREDILTSIKEFLGKGA